jgi:hypothetical protein
MESKKELSSEKLGPIIVVKNQNAEFYRIIRMSDVGFRGEGIIFCRLTDLDFPYDCFDDNLNRIAFYRSVINQLIMKGFEIAEYEVGQVTNTLHDNIVNFCIQHNLKIISIELNENEFPF